MSNDEELNDAAVAWGICEEGETLNAAKLNWFMNSRKGTNSIKAEGIREAVAHFYGRFYNESGVIFASAPTVMKKYADKLEGKGE